MKKKKPVKRPLICFIILSYIIFFVIFIIIGISMLLGVPDSITNLLQVIAAWSSTFAFMILFKRIQQEVSLIAFIKKQFAERIRPSVLINVVSIQVLILFVAIIVLSNIQGTLAFSFTSFGLLLIAFIDSLVRGPLGEELGWRGYALSELQKKYSPLLSAIIIGFLWGFWHTPLWFASGYTGMNLIKYIVLFMIGIVSISIMMTLFFNLNKNLVIPIVIHQLFNFSLVVIPGEVLDVLLYIMPCYVIVALLLIVINPRKILYGRDL